MFRRILAVFLLVFTTLAEAQDEVPFSSYRERFQRRTQFFVPDDNPSSEAKIVLGKTLFFDPRLSGNNAMSCATCHNPKLAWSDGVPKALGAGGKTLNRRTPSLLNVAFARHLMWDNSFSNLEDQALAPIRKKTEMNQDLKKLPAEIAAIAGYQPLFEAAFPGEKIDVKNIARALAAFQRTLVSGESPWSRYLAGEENALSLDARLGMQVFNSKGSCTSCHMGWVLSDYSGYDLGLKANTDKGYGLITKDKFQNFKFRNPSLLDVARRAPYMHDGSLPDLEAVIEFYDKGGEVHRPSKSMDVRPLHLTSREKFQLKVYLESLTSVTEDVEMPVLPE